MSSKKPVLKEIPDVVVNPDTGATYKKGRFLGKGGFARCYELTDIKDQRSYAGKVVSKLLLLKSHQRDKVHVSCCGIVEEFCMITDFLPIFDCLTDLKLSGFIGM